MSTTKPDTEPTDIPILDDAVAKIEARYKKATEPPWDALSIEQSLEADKWMRGDNNKNDSIFMAHAREEGENYFMQAEQIMEILGQPFQEQEAKQS